MFARLNLVHLVSNVESAVLKSFNPGHISTLQMSKMSTKVFIYLPSLWRVFTDLSHSPSHTRRADTTQQL